jgi:hypothetical protein
MIEDIKSWIPKVIDLGRIPQDNDTETSQSEKESHFNQYISLVEMVSGLEGAAVAKALIRSIHAGHDYGAYQGTLNKLLFDFPSEIYVQSLIEELPALISRNRDWAGDLLNTFIRNEKSEELINLFNIEIFRTTAINQEIINQFIREEENGGWLEDFPGLLGIK